MLRMAQRNVKPAGIPTLGRSTEKAANARTPMMDEAPVAMPRAKPDWNPPPWRNCQNLPERLLTRGLDSAVSMTITPSMSVKEFYPNVDHEKLYEVQGQEKGSNQFESGFQ